MAVASHWVVQEGFPERVATVDLLVGFGCELERGKKTMTDARMVPVELIEQGADSDACGARKSGHGGTPTGSCRLIYGRYR